MWLRMGYSRGFVTRLVESVVVIVLWILLMRLLMGTGGGAGGPAGPRVRRKEKKTHISTTHILLLFNRMCLHLENQRLE
jgi:hypothetical protein